MFAANLRRPQQGSTFAAKWQGVRACKALHNRVTYFDDSNYDVLEAFAFRVVVQNERPINAFGTSKGRRLHSWVNSGQVVVQRVQVLQKVLRGGAQHLKDGIVARILTKLKEHSTEHFQDFVGGNFCALTVLMTLLESASNA